MPPRRSGALVPIFFALSGFLVTGSALRLTIGKFVLSRVLRIVPALAVDTLVMVLLIGPLVTTLPLGTYFTDPGTAKYLLNIVGEIHFTLPGVFTGNPLKGVVNGSLWTIPPELGCYPAMSALILFGWVRSWRIVALGAAAVFALVVLASSVGDLLSAVPADLTVPLQHGLERPGIKLVGFFLLGSLAFLLRGRIPYSPRLAGLSLLLFPIGAAFGSAAWIGEPLWVLGTALPLTYLMAFLGLTKLPKLPFFDRGDYSYGIYLYGFPIQQLMMHLFAPASPFALFALTLLPVTALAIFSWHVVEKPTLRLRKAFSMAAKIEAERERERAAEAAAPAAPRAEEVRVAGG